MKVTTLIENTTCRDDLTCEHGLSLYIETENHRILFDAGQTGAFAVNAEKLGIDLRQVNFAVLSHGHYDHGGGLSRFLEINRTASVYLNRDAFLPHWNGTTKYIGLDPSLLDCGRLIFTEDRLEIAQGIHLYTCNSKTRPFPADSFGLNASENGRILPDDFRHEQYLLIEENGKRICISGCSHKGILNIVHWFQPDILIGGFHFKKLDPMGDGAKVLTDAAHRLMAYPTLYYTGHCTGTAQFHYMKQIMGQRLQGISVGTVLTI